MKTISASIGRVFEAISTIENHVFTEDVEYFQKSRIEIQNERGDWYPVGGVITKRDRIRTLHWSDGSVTECADRHWIRTEGETCKLASEFTVGDEIVRADGATLICLSTIVSDDERTVYDLQIDSPAHLYQTENGVVHHNTLLLNSIARMMDVPIVTYDTTSLTESGYIGGDIEDAVSRLLQAADNDVKRAERGIIFLDEIDKKAKRESSGTTNRDVAGEGVQQALLKLLEGSDIMVPISGRKGPNAELVKVNTRNILFILGGAFVGLDKIVGDAIEGGGGIGFGAKIDPTAKTPSQLLTLVEADHLIKYGMIPELVGRVPVISVLHDLDEDQLMTILTEPKNSLVKQYTKMFALDGIVLSFDEDALREIAKLARTRKTNGRALRGVIENRLLRTQFDLPDLREQGVEKIVVTLETIRDRAVPNVVYRKKKNPAPVTTFACSAKVA